MRLPASISNRVETLLIQVLTASFFGLSCGREVPSIKAPDLPVGWPTANTVADNPFNGERAALGKELFFDTRLSAENNVSCGTCHQPERAWSVDEELVMGTSGTRFFRHPPSLVNVAFFLEYHWDGGTTSLEKQILAPLENPDEMNIRIDTLIERLQADPYYKRRFREVFDRDPDMYGLTRSLAAYERALVSYNSKWDQVEAGTAEWTKAEAKGEALFYSSVLKCSSCHTPPLFTDREYHNTGLWKWGDFDPGRSRVTLDSADLGKFKTPTLRNIGLSSPYFHNGSVREIEEVLAHYSRGGNGNQNQDSLVSGFELSSEDQENLIAFLRALNDSTSIANPELLP